MRRRINKKRGGLRTVHGTHYLVELIECDPEMIKRVKTVRAAFLSAAQKSKATVIKDSFHQFKTHGVSGVLLIAESHFAVHTWPENRYAACDILTCGKTMKPNKAISAIKKAFGARKVKILTVQRGL